ncbi:hypothetical protein FB446DRAFT_699203 [Lentinula raphanica]|nr:hypothetical protein FB446DRAFT_699203 [Lentinula raphanica]
MPDVPIGYRMSGIRKEAVTVTDIDGAMHRMSGKMDATSLSLSTSIADADKAGDNSAAAVSIVIVLAGIEEIGSLDEPDEVTVTVKGYTGAGAEDPLQKLHVGDTVDVGFSVVGIEKGRDTKAHMVLRNITLLDARHAQAWLKVKTKSQLRVTIAKPKLTRAGPHWVMRVTEVTDDARIAQEKGHNRDNGR